MKTIKKQTQKFRKDFGIKKSPDLDALKKAIHDLGYELKSYKGNEELLSELGVTELAKHVPSLTARKAKRKFVFYDSTILEKDLPFIFAHEIGHIYLNHMRTPRSYFDTSAFREKEANQFAVYLMEGQTVKNKALWIAGIIAVIICIGLCMSGLFQKDKIPEGIADPDSPVQTEKMPKDIADPESPVQTEKMPEENTVEITQPETEQPQEPRLYDLYEDTEAEPLPDQEDVPENQTTVEEGVIITRTGKRYHKPDCHTIKNSINLERVSIPEAEAQHLTPCAYCFK